ncbi:hypothetical protein [Luteibacter sp. dw_328]|uniref:hypothetical protein n=1 Tax=Luteibacter sp. dw_328 TaxID=2719796 RepID=UPI001BD3328B|nr:hypothetical protein [Luteibacter sp. dw_328]
MSPARRRRFGNGYTPGVDSREYNILSIAALVREAADMNDAALASDLDEARFRAQLIAARADEVGYVDLALAAAHLVVILGPDGTTPLPGYGAGMLRVANALEALGFDPEAYIYDFITIVIIINRPNGRVCLEWLYEHLRKFGIRATISVHAAGMSGSCRRNRSLIEQFANARKCCVIGQGSRNMPRN